MLHLVGALAASSYALTTTTSPALIPSTRPRTIAPAMVDVDVDKVFRRAEFWEEETATLLEVVNVLGRCDKCSEWLERTEFAVVEKAREESMRQGASVERYDYARRNGLVERVALSMNANKLPFKNEKLAASVGKTVEEMNEMPVSPVACEIVFDAIAQSKSSLIPEKAVDERLATFVTAEGAFDEGAFMGGMAKSRLAVIVGFFLLGKGQRYGYVVGGRVLLDYTGTYDKVKDIFGPYTEPIVWGATLAAVVYAYVQSMEVTKKTGVYETYSREEALALEKRMDTSTTVFDKWAGGGAPPAPEESQQ